MDLLLGERLSGCKLSHPSSIPLLSRCSSSSLPFYINTSTMVTRFPRTGAIGKFNIYGHINNPNLSNTHTNTHTHTHTLQSRPTQGVCTVPGRGAISSNGRKLVSVICCHGGLHWHRLTLDQSRRDTDVQSDKKPGRGEEGVQRGRSWAAGPRVTAWDSPLKASPLQTG